MSHEVSQIETSLEALIRSGNLAEAKRQFATISKTIKSLERKEKLKYANFARRLGLVGWALKILNPIVRPANRFAEPASVEEQIEYAACLRTEGAPREALAILKTVDLQKFPAANFQIASCLISEWRYDDAIPFLKAYVSESQAPTYSVLVGKVNLLAAMIYESRHKEASELLGQLNGELDTAQHGLLHRNVLELAAQLAVAKGDGSMALVYLQEASTLAKHAPESVYALHIAKWTAVAHSLLSHEGLEELIEVRARGITIRHWETVRDCDFYIARVRNDREMLIHLYFGTPFASFRRKIIETLGPTEQIPQSYVWAGGGGIQTRVFDLRSAAMTEGGVGLEAGKVLHRFLVQMCSDFYRPTQLLSIFSSIFPGEYFTLGAPNRIHQVIRRFRIWSEQNQVPLAIEKNRDGYNLRFTGRFAILMSKEALALDERELTLTKLHASFVDGSFSARQAMEVLGVSQPTVHRLMTWAIENGKAVHQGNTHQSRYRLTG
jgi:hypothetical protein